MSIKYSLTMRPKKDIAIYNAAVGRIKKAKAANQEPAAEDEAIVEAAEMGAYASLQSDKTLSLEEFAEHITSHGCVYSKGDIYGILVQATDCIKEMLLEGHRVDLGDLGTFWLSITQRPADSLAEYNSGVNIKSLRGAWLPSSAFRGLITKAKFELSTTKKTTSAVIKAQKHGVPTVKI